MSTTTLFDPSPIAVSILERLIEKRGKFASVESVVDIIVDLMEIADTMETLTGPQKKEVVLIAVRLYFINYSQGDTLDKWDPVLQRVVPFIIDKLIEAKDGKLIFNRGIKRKMKKLGSKLVSCCKKKN